YLLVLSGKPALSEPWRVCLCLDWRGKFVEFVWVKNSGLQTYLIACGFHRSLGSLNCPFEFFKLDDLVAMLRLQCPVDELLAMHLGDSRETYWGRHKGLSRNRVERIWIAGQGVSLLLCHRGNAVDLPQHQTDLPLI